MIQSISRGAVAAALVASAASMQANAQAVTLAGGARMYGGDDGESALMVAVRTEFPVGTSALVEFASSVSDVPEPTRSAVRSVFEAQVQLPIPLGEVLTPYFGAGAGIGNVNRVSTSDDGGWKGVLSASAGVRVAVAEQLGVVVDARVRGIGTEFRGSHTDLTVGLRYQLNRPDRPRFRGAPR
ncbi:MAG: hypothetical protein KY467_09795 [Gemmatimonadetes bacterium]|nr:hypothetical protein [Gemmatimonadota bacterium]